MSHGKIDGKIGSVPTYQAFPDGEGPHPGVVVIHDALGMTKDARRHADWLAASGYLAIVPDLYGRGNKLACVRATFKALAARQGQAFDDIEAARRTLVDRPDCSGKVGIIGFCMGGGFALVAAAGRGFDASSVNYGEVPKDAPSLLAGACPVVGSFGGKDRMLKGAAAALERALAVNDVPRDVVEYPDANHSFLDRHEGIGGWLMARFGLEYQPREAEDAHRRILAFFATHLRGEGAGCMGSEA